jgi:hypothetical protein
MKTYAEKVIFGFDLFNVNNLNWVDIQKPVINIALTSDILTIVFPFWRSLMTLNQKGD